jgi:hypothetical protein
MATLEENAQWIDSLKASGTPILDIGPSPTYSNYPGITSDFYAMELQRTSGYEGYIPLWGPWMQ